MSLPVLAVLVGRGPSYNAGCTSNQALRVDKFFPTEPRVCLRVLQDLRPNTLFQHEAAPSFKAARSHVHTAQSHMLQLRSRQVFVCSEHDKIHRFGRFTCRSPDLIKQRKYASAGALLWPPLELQPLEPFSIVKGWARRCSPKPATPNRCYKKLFDVSMQNWHLGQSTEGRTTT